MSDGKSIAANETLRSAGNVSIRKLEIYTASNFMFDVTNQTISIEMYEDIFAPFISMQLVLRESLDLINNLPLTGEETMVVEIATPTFDKPDHVIKNTFYLYKISGQTAVTDRNIVYIIHAISAEAMVDMNVKLSKTYDGNVGAIAERIIKDELMAKQKNYFCEQTKNNTKYTSNFWSPARNLNFLAAQAQNVNGNSNYVFFENRIGFNFISLDYLYQINPYQAFTNDDYIREVTQNGTVLQNIDREYQKILDFKVGTTFDSMKNLQSGMYASKLFSYDLTRKKYEVLDHFEYDVFTKKPHLNKGRPFSNTRLMASTNLLMNETKHTGAQNSYGDTSNTNFQQLRNSSMQLLRSMKVQIRVFGRTDYTVGQKVFLKIPRTSVINKDDPESPTNPLGVYDQWYSGFYLVTAINHTFTREDHTCVMELCKESIYS